MALSSAVKVDEELLEEQPVKKQRTASTAPRLQNYTDVNFTTWSTRVKGKNAYNSPVIYINSNRSSHFSLHHRDDPRSTIPFKIDLAPTNGAAVPSFLSGGEQLRATEGLDLQLTLCESQVKFVAQLDAWVLQQALTFSSEWFGKLFTQAELEAMYTPCLRQDPDHRYKPGLKSKMILVGGSELLTKVIYMKGGVRIATGSGWDFVKPLLGTSNWRGYEARAALDVTSIWIVGKKFGLRTTFSDLLIWETEASSSVADFPELNDY
jgi:hypothetical protein